MIYLIVLLLVVIAGGVVYDALRMYRDQKAKERIPSLQWRIINIQKVSGTGGTSEYYQFSEEVDWDEELRRLRK